MILFSEASLLILRTVTIRQLGILFSTTLKLIILLILMPARPVCAIIIEMHYQCTIWSIARSWGFFSSYCMLHNINVVYIMVYYAFTSSSNLLVEWLNDNFTLYNFRRNHFYSISSMFIGSTEGIALIEHIMDHIAAVTNLDPVAVRMTNLSPTFSSSIPPMINDVTQNSDLVNRKKQVETFNAVSTQIDTYLPQTTMNLRYTFIIGKQVEKKRYIGGRDELPISSSHGLSCAHICVRFWWYYRYKPWRYRNWSRN